jgi:hypothetical protein
MLIKETAKAVLQILRGAAMTLFGCLFARDSVIGAD